MLQNLIDSIRAGNNALTAGDIGFHYLIDALTKEGASSLICEMNNRDDVPGYGFQLRKGATTLTESWQALEIVSNNHLMLGHLMEWFYQGLGGIRQETSSAGYKKSVISPEVVEGISHTNVSYQSPYGMISTNWEKSDSSFTMAVKIPVNTESVIRLPFPGEVTITSNGKPVGDEYIPEYLGMSEGRMTYRSGSGRYEFYVKLK